MADRSPHITELVEGSQAGDTAASARLLELVYGELHRLASRYMSGERIDHTLQTTGLVHEAYLKILGAELPWEDRVHFFAVPARVMRQILVDHAGAKGEAARLRGYRSKMRSSSLPRRKASLPRRRARFRRWRTRCATSASTVCLPAARRTGSTHWCGRSPR